MNYNKTELFCSQVKHSGTKLSQQVYAFLTYVQTAEQDDLYGKENAKDKSNTGAGGKVCCFVCV